MPSCKQFLYVTFLFPHCGHMRKLKCHNSQHVYVTKCFQGNQFLGIYSRLSIWSSAACKTKCHRILYLLQHCKQRVTFAADMNIRQLLCRRRFYVPFTAQALAFAIHSFWLKSLQKIFEFVPIFRLFPRVCEGPKLKAFCSPDRAGCHVYREFS